MATLKLSPSEATLEQVMAALFSQYPRYEKVFRKHFYREGKLFALFICRGMILQSDSILKDGDLIKIVSPISGG